MLKAQVPLVLDSFPLVSEIKQEARKLKDLLAQSKTVLISSTLTSDGDSIGAQLGLYSLVRALSPNVEVWMVDQSPVPERYQFLKGSEKILSIDEWNALKQKPTFDLGITCDGGIERTGDVAALFENISRTVLVDHHAVGSQRAYGSKLLDVDVSSTCELVYLLHEHFGVDVPANLAEALYVGIVFDTGFFKHSLTKPKTHFVAARLIATGIDFSKISDRAILERTWEAQLLLKTMLGNMSRELEGRVLISYWAQADLKAIPYKDGDQEGMINQLYYTESAQVVVLMTERAKKDLKISFRSKGQVNVAELARSLDPEGGGHVRASGCSLKMTLEDAKNLILEKILEALRA